MKNRMLENSQYTQDLLALETEQLAVLEERLAALSPTIAAAEQSFRRDMGLLDATVAFLNEQGARAESRGLRESLSAAKRCLDVEEAVRAELTEAVAQHARLRRKVARARKRLLTLGAQAARLEAAAAMERPPPRPLLTLLELCDGVEFADPRISRFAAAKGLRRLDFVAAALRAPLEDVGGVRVSAEPIPVPAIVDAAHMAKAVAVGRDGTVCCANSCFLGVAGAVSLSSLFPRAAVRVKFPGARWACTFANKLFVCVVGTKEVRFAPVPAVAEGLRRDGFGAFAVPGEICDATVERAADGWIVLLCELPRPTLVRVDLRARSCRPVPSAGVPASLGSLSGVCIPGALCLVEVEAGAERTVFVVFEDGRAEAVTCGATGGVALLPSAKRPADFARAAVFDEFASLFYRGRKLEPRVPFSCSYKSLVRVFRDVFVYFNQDSGWVARRIAVP